jgi:hypothetical protein
LLTALVKLPVLVMVCVAIYVALVRFLGVGDLADLPLIGKFFQAKKAEQTEQTVTE